MSEPITLTLGEVVNVKPMATARLHVAIRKAWWLGPLYCAGYVWCWLRLPMDPDWFMGVYAQGYRIEAVEG